MAALSEKQSPAIDVLNLEETAEYLRVSNQTVYNMIKDGRIKAYKVGREWRFLRQDIAAYMNSSSNTDFMSMAAKGGKISAIVPMVSHLDHSEHSVNIVITEQGVADLRGKSPKERAQAIIENCAHPDYKQLLWDYLKLAGGKAQTPHAIQAALGMHAELAKSGDMKNTNWAEYAR